MVNARREGGKRGGRLAVRADDPTLTPYAGLVVVGALARSLGLVEEIDRELRGVARAKPVKRRRRGRSPGELLVSLAESQLAGGEFFADLDELRADRAGAPLRTVAETPSAPTALQLAKLFRRSHLQALERALARCGQALDRALGRDPGEPVTIDLDATEVEVYGKKKQGAKRSRTGALAYAPYVASWAERGRALAWELEPGNKAKLPARESARLCRRALRLLSAGHGEVTFRLDSAFYALELLHDLRRLGARFTCSCPRTQAMWEALEAIPEEAWQEALAMAGAEVAETTYAPAGWQGEPLRLIVRRVLHAASELSRDPRARRQRTIHPDQLALALGGELDSVFGYSFILSDRDGDARELERFHRERAQIEERFKEAKLGQALRHLPSGDVNANRVWLSASLLALTLGSMCCDLCPAARASGKAPKEAPLRRAAKTLRRLLLRVPARVVRSARRTILRLPAGFRHAEVFRRTYEAAYALAPP